MEWYDIASPDLPILRTVYTVAIIAGCTYSSHSMYQTHPNTRGRLESNSCQAPFHVHRVANFGVVWSTSESRMSLQFSLPFFFGHGETSLRWPWSHALTPLGLNGRLTALGLALNFGDRGLGSSIRTIAYVIKSGNGIITNRGQNAN